MVPLRKVSDTLSSPGYCFSESNVRRLNQSRAEPARFCKATNSSGVRPPKLRCGSPDPVSTYLTTYVVVLP